MGEYADMEIDSHIGDWNGKTGYGIFPYPHLLNPQSKLHVHSVLGESEKAWNIILGTPEHPWKHSLWFPKSRCGLSNDEKLLTVPDWLMSEKIKEYNAKKTAQPQAKEQ